MNQPIRRFDNLHDYNEYLSLPTLHPLVGVVDFSQVPPMRHSINSFGFYVIFLKDVNCGDMRYGCNYYDYQEGTLVFLSPGQIAGVVDNGEMFQPKGYALMFHPDLIRGTQLGRTIKEYTFFSYESREALHLSESERHVIMECLGNIRTEISRPVDKHSRRLIVSNIELFLNYCVRFYDRQFITRENVNLDIITRFEALLHDYFSGDKAGREGLPSVKYCASQLNLSPNYFGDLVKKTTGKTPLEHIRLKLIDAAKELVLDPARSVSEVAYMLGFQYPQHFSRFFKKHVGITPGQFRASSAAVL